MSEETKKSSFVTTVAWIGIILFGIISFILLIQNINLFTLVESHDELLMKGQIDLSPGFFENTELLYFSFPVLLLTSLALSVSGIGLLKRKNWGRLSFVGLLSALIFGNLLMVIVRIVSFHQISRYNSLTLELVGPFSLVPIITIICSTIITLAICALFVFIIFKLLSEEIKKEFVTSERSR